MPDPRVDLLEQEIASIKTMFEGLIKQMAENSKALAELSKGSKNLGGKLDIQNSQKAVSRVLQLGNSKISQTGFSNVQRSRRSHKLDLQGGIIL
jgi:phage shock protein A